MSDRLTRAKRLAPQFSLQSLFLLILILGCLLAWKMDTARRQAASVAWIREVGGSVLYDYEVDERGKALGNAESQVPTWFIDQLGIDVFHKVVGANLTNSEALDLTPLCDLKRLRQLRLAYTDVSDLTPLSDLTELRILDLDGTDVTDLSPLTGIRHLRQLNVDHSRVSDISPLVELMRLEGFYCQHTTVSDLSPLASHAWMRSLNLTGSRVTDLSPLADLKRLEKLDMRATGVTDLSPLAGITTLRHVDIFDTPVCDLSPLEKATALRVEIGGKSVKELAPLAGMDQAAFVLYKYPHEQVPNALKPRLQQVNIRPIYKRYGE